MDKKTPTEWETELEVIVRDPDGWDRTNFWVDWAIPLTRKEFLAKMCQSTVQFHNLETMKGLLQ